MTFRTDVEPLEEKDYRAQISAKKGRVFLSIGEEFVFLDEARTLALRDWLNRVLDSYPAREGCKMVPVELPTRTLMAVNITRKQYAVLLAELPTEQTVGEP